MRRINHQIPFFPYRFLFLYFEPFAAFAGALKVVLTPVSYLQVFSPSATSTTYNPLEQPIYDQVGALLLLFAWCQAVVLRVAGEDVRVWKSILFGMFLCDCVHLASQYRILGWEVFVNPSRWRMEEWVNFVMLYGPGSLRLAFCAGLGLGEDGSRVKRAAKGD
ncbi:hypothetical protein EPUS_00473 [Endocarpon pusillum Z07020]|uniref:DUF7704 domain-containing protein n=1 Tax=Endocarpon pusillum (strain Z07020 / HMAS-L-300199) TaxID=1263415 RepID=U1HQV3_ENDPU|nr:uncharacterized protein EPUS_00473 [Endocarpon pusillum Z07020]ERF71484.1 hypothetical protein EPUS_00473 [Endocarpon pusillum Z07020]